MTSCLLIFFCLYLRPLSGLERTNLFLVRSPALTPRLLGLMTLALQTVWFPPSLAVFARPTHTCGWGCQAPNEWPDFHFSRHFLPVSALLATLAIDLIYLLNLYYAIMPPYSKLFLFSTSMSLQFKSDPFVLHLKHLYCLYKYTHVRFETSLQCFRVSFLPEVQWYVTLKMR